jgi:hypothetical protein
MELAVEAELYVPSIDEHGNYIDKVPPSSVFKNGLRCPCGSRKDKVYESYTLFATHIKSKCHQKWLDNVNLNKANYYIENENLKETVWNQRLIIAKLEKELQNKIMTIDFLTQQIVRPVAKPVTNLIDL